MSFDPASYVIGRKAGGGGGATIHVYGVSWPTTDGILTASKGTRTDDAAAFADPVPSVNGSSGSSPFDALLPWSGMIVEADQLAGAMVKIPRFWYKWTKTASALKLQIADGPEPGFCISPAHADRGDGKGEREYVYIARYKCASQAGISVSGEAPVVQIPRYFLRTMTKYGTDMGGTHVTPGNYGIYQQDVAMFWTVRMLMLVEYANWDGQAALGYGCGESGQEAPLSTGTTDAMRYHTGTVQASLDTYGQGIQYRYIEDLWAGCAEWLDGYCVDTNSDWDNRQAYLQTNPQHYADYPQAMTDVMDASDNGWPEWCAADVDLMTGDFSGDDPADYFDAATMQAIGAWIAQNSSDYWPEYQTLGGAVAICVDIAGTRVFRKRIQFYRLNGSGLEARTDYFNVAGQKVRAVLDLNGGTMYGEGEDGNQAMSQQQMLLAMIGSATVDGVRIGKVGSGWIGGWTFPENAGLGWFGIPVTENVGQSDSKVADGCYLRDPSLCCGAFWYRDPDYGPFCLYSSGAANAGTGIGARLQKLP